MDDLTAADPQKIGPFVLLGILGSGGMGKVYKGMSVGGEEVAVKVIHKHMINMATIGDRFVQEVETLKTVYGPRVATLVDAATEADPAWLAVQFVDGSDLNAWVKGHGPLPVEMVAILGAALAEGLATIHKAGLLHRDLKPHNILLGPYGPMLIDFGLAVLKERDSTMTATGIAVGTPAYMSPEQALAEKHLTAASDIYSLAATLLYALTGEHVPRSKHASVAADPAKVPIALGPILHAMLATNPMARPGLDEIVAQMVAVATADGSTAKQARDRLITETFGEVGGAGPYVEPPAAVTVADPEPEPRPAPEPEPEPVPKPRVDLDWLVNDLRGQYMKEAPL